MGLGDDKEFKVHIHHPMFHKKSAKGNCKKRGENYLFLPFLGMVSHTLILHQSSVRLSVICLIARKVHQDFRKRKE